jgi:hypothetical protein
VLWLKGNQSVETGQTHKSNRKMYAFANAINPASQPSPLHAVLLYGQYNR